MSEAASPARSNNSAPESVALINIPPNNPPIDPDDNDSGLDTGYDERLTQRLNHDGGPRSDVVMATPMLIHNVCPPKGKYAEYSTRALVCLAVWGAMYCVVGDDAWFGGNLFALYVLLVLASLFGFLISRKTRYFSLPALLGMLIVGFLLKNVKAVSIASDINPDWSRTLRQIALAVILLRSGLGLDIGALKRLRFTVLRLAFIPCITEAMTVTVVSHYLLGLPWLWGLQLGYVFVIVFFSSCLRVKLFSYLPLFHSFRDSRNLAKTKTLNNFT